MLGVADEILTGFDNDECTLDICQQDGTCFHLPTGAPECQASGCFNDAECTDSDPCTVDVCTSGVCGHITTPCADGEPCTIDGPELCVPYVGCVTEADPTCGGLVCSFDFDCPFTDPCVEPKCTNAQCSYTLKDCDDSDPTTRDICSNETGACINEPYALGNWNGCTEDADCAADNACLAGFCEDNGQCVWDVSPCTDFNPCTASFCDPVDGCLHILDPDCEGCSLNADCDDGNYCTQDLCAGGSCEYEPLPTPECGGSGTP